MHYTVAVICKEVKELEVEKLLAPYNELLADEGGASYSQAKWDWWTIGGRWSGLLNGSDDARIGDIANNLPDDFSTYAVVTPDGNWHAPGEMGWFCSSESEEEWSEWQKHYKERFITSSNPDWHIFIVDCHI